MTTERGKTVRSRVSKVLPGGRLEAFRSRSVRRCAALAGLGLEDLEQRGQGCLLVGARESDARPPSRTSAA